MSWVVGVRLELCEDCGGVCLEDDIYCRYSLSVFFVVLWPTEQLLVQHTVPVWALTVVSLEQPQTCQE